MINLGRAYILRGNPQGVYSRVVHLTDCPIVKSSSMLLKVSFQDFDEVLDLMASERGFIYAAAQDFDSREELILEKKIFLTDLDLTKFCKKCQSKIRKYIKPVEIENGEWYYKGCFIQSVNHPSLSHKFEVWKDDETQSRIGQCDTLFQAKKLCEENVVFKPKNGLKSYLG